MKSKSPQKQDALSTPFSRIDQSIHYLASDSSYRTNFGQHQPLSNREQDSQIPHIFPLNKESPSYSDKQSFQQVNVKKRNSVLKPTDIFAKGERLRHMEQLIQNLDSGQAYEVRCSILNFFGWSEESDIFTFYTAQG